MRSVPHLAAFCLALTPLFSAANQFDRKGVVDAVLAEDLNGDGKKELILQAGRTLVIYYYREPRGYSMAEDRRVEFVLPDEVGLYTFADLDGTPGVDLVGLTGSGVRVWRIEGTEIDPKGTVLVSGATALENTILETPRMRDFAPDLDGDGDRDLMVPGLGHFAFHLQVSPGVFEQKQRMPIDVEATLSMGGGVFQNTVVRAVTFPRTWLTDIDGDGARDFVRFDGPVMTVHLRESEGLFAGEPSTVIDFNKFVDRRRRRRDLNGAYSAASPELADLNADGKADVVIMLPGKGKVGIFNGGGEKPYEGGQVVALSGWTFRRDGIELLRDLNRDGRPDLVVLNIPQLGVWDMLEVLFQQKLEVKTFFYLARPDGSFPVHDHEFSATVPLILSITRDNVRIETPFLMTFGDTNGDGLDDLIIKDAPNRLDIRFGQAIGVFSKSVGRQIEILDSRGMSSEPSIVTDLNGDGTDDLILHSHDFELGITRIEVIRMKKE